MPKRPIYTTPEDIKVGITFGKELMFTDTLQEYFGEYHVYPNTAIYSSAEYDPRVSRELMKYVPYFDNPINQTYLKISKKLFVNYTTPTNYFRTITPEDYKIGKIVRFFIQKINEPSKIYEVDEESFKAYNRSNQPGANAFLYRRDIVQWQLTGNIDLIYKVNALAIQKAEKTLPGIGTYLLTDPVEFAKITYTEARNNLFTPGGQYVDSNGNNFVGAYHIRKNGEADAYQGAIEISGINKALFLVK